MGSPTPHGVNQQDRRLIRGAVERVNEIGLQRSARLSGVSEERLHAFTRGERPKYLHTETRTGLTRLVSEPSEADLRRRAVHAMEEIATAVVILTEHFCPVVEEDDD
jgi:hypothetical protein